MSRCVLVAPARFLWDSYVGIECVVTARPYSQGLELWNKWTYCSLDFSREQYKKRPLVFERLIPYASILADFCAANNLHRILLPTTAHTPLDAWRKLFTIVRLIAAFALLAPSHCLYLSQNDHRTRERRHGNRGNSTI